MADYSKEQFPFDAVGVALNVAPDVTIPGLTPILENWRPELDDTLSVRPGQGTGREVVAGQSPIHSIFRLEDSSSGSTVATEIIGTGTHLAICATDLASSSSSDSGFSGDPLAIVKHRPQESLKEWAYVADRARMRKIDAIGNDKRIGLPAPKAAPAPKLSAPVYKALDEMNTPGDWVNGGTVAAAPISFTRIDSATRTVTRFLWDTGNSGWACVRPSSMADVGVGTRLTVDSGGSAETVTVEQVFRGSGSTTIAAIIYQSGTGSGLCAVHLATPLEEIEPDSLMLFDNGAGTTEYVRVLAVSRTQDNLLSIVCSTSATFALGHSVVAHASFRAYFASTHANGVAMGAVSVQFSATVGKGWIDHTISLDLSKLADGVPTRPEDFMHIDVQVDDPTVVNELRVMLDIDSSTNDFTRNYLLHGIRPNDLTPVAALEQTVLSNLQIQRQRDIIDGGLAPDRAPDSGDEPSNDGVRAEERAERRATRLANIQQHLSAGDNQWAGVRFRIGELLGEVGRVGNDRSRGLANVAKLRILVWCTATVQVRVDGWWIGGGYGPEVGVADRPFVYRYRGRDSSTGAVGNYSPASRVSVRPQRQKVVLPLALHPATECDKLDVQRYGGALLGWYYVGTVDNSGSPQLIDTMSPDDVVHRQSFSNLNVNYELWPVRSTPLSGSCNTAGNLVSLLGLNFISTATAPGTEIRINDGVSSRTYFISEIVDAATFWIDESAGAQTTAGWEIANPLLTAQSLPVLAGPHYGFFFGAGDPLNPGRVYYTNGDDCDTTRDTHYFDIPGETVLQIVCGVADRAIVFGVHGVYSIEPSFSTADSGSNLFRYVNLAASVSAFSRWSICSTGESIMHLGRDGSIYETVGSGARLISSDLKTILPHEGSVGVATNGFAAVDVSAARAARLRLSYANGELFFDYVDTGGSSRTLVLSRLGEQRTGWRPYSYSIGAVLHYQENGQHVGTVLMGGTDGKLYRFARAQADAAGASITATVRTPSKDFNDGTNRKIFSEIRISYDTNGATLTLTPGFDNHSTTIAPTSLNEASGRRQRTIDIDSGRGQRATNISLSITTTVTTQRPVLYFWTAAFLGRPDTTLLRTPDWRTGPHPVNLLRGIYIHADTFDVARSALFEYTIDDGTTASFTINGIDHPVLTKRYYPITGNVYAVAHRLRPTDAATWEILDYELDADPAPIKSTQPTPWQNPAGPNVVGARFVHGCIVDADTDGANIDLGVYVDQETLQTTIQNGSHSGPLNCNGRAQIPFSFEVPFITHLIQALPSAACRIFSIRWISNPEPEIAYMWKTQQTNCGIAGWKLFGDGYLTIRSTEAVRFFIIADGVSREVTFYESTNSSGNRRRYRFRCPYFKAKSVEFMLHTTTEAGRAAVYEKDFTLEIKEWGFEGSWNSINPLGDLHFENGARI